MRGAYCDGTTVRLRDELPCRKSTRRAVKPRRALSDSWTIAVVSSHTVCVLSGRHQLRRVAPYSGTLPASFGPAIRTAGACRAASDRGGQAVGRRYRSAAAVTRRALPARSPGRLPGAFTALVAVGDLVLKRASRLVAFSAYPFPTWLPGDALSRTAGTPEVSPSQSSRTRDGPSQVSHTHGR